MNYDAIDAAWEAAGHSNEACGGWKYEPSLGIIRCADGGTVALPAEAVTSPPSRPLPLTELDDLDWKVIHESRHWCHPGWSRDSRDGALVCSCGTVLREPEEAAA